VIDAAALLDPASLGRYDRLALAVRAGMRPRRGERRFPGVAEPSGVEVEGHAPYAPGDDLRHLDWNAYARLDALLVRRFTAEREVEFHLLLDASASMAIPAGDRKLEVACELAMALAWMALGTGDAVRTAILAGGTAEVGAAVRGRTGARRIAERLAGARVGGRLDLGATLAAHARRRPGPAVSLVLSDFMTAPEDVATGVEALRARRHEVVLLQVLGPGELDPRREFADAVLVDVESGAEHPMALDAASFARYRALLDEHLTALAALAARTGARYARLASDAPVAAFVTGELARLGLVHRR
jgi:uncharacterized protein (DUF58 family)